jgi:hypothetical protein
VPVPSTVTGVGPTFTYDVPASSVVVLTLKRG